jgi:parallel beta-helix repeat protein
MRRALVRIAAVAMAAVVVMACVLVRPVGAAGRRPSWCRTPAAAVRVEAGQSIQAAVDARPEGTSFLLAAGVHRLASVEPKRGDRFYGQLDRACRRLTTLSGARLSIGFTPVGRFWAAGGQDQHGQVHGQCELGWPRCDRPEDVYVDDRPLRHAESLEEVGPGSYFFDYDTDTVYLADDPTGARVEIATARHAFGPAADDVTVQGMVIEKYAVPAQMGAVGDQFPRSGWQVVGNEIRLNHGTGLMLGPGSRAHGNYLHHNGQQGFAARGAGVLVDGNEIAYNNYAHVDPRWEAGALKVQRTQSIVIRGNCVHDNAGPGIWVDIDNTNSIIEANTVFGNDEMGIFFEISQGATIRDNRVGRNGRINPGWLYGANILISSSTNADVYRNRVEVDAGFGNAIAIIGQPRTDEQGTLYQGTGSRVHHNDVTFLGAAGVQGAAADFPAGMDRIFATNSFSANAYHVTDPAAAHFAWAGNNLASFAEFQSHGQDVDATLDTNSTPARWSCPI